MSMLKLQVLPMCESVLARRMLVVALSLAGVTAVLLATSRYGAGLTPDSVEYIASARSLAAGKGYLRHDGLPMVEWSPLFPTILAGLSLLGLDPLDGARLLNAVAFGLLIFASGELFSRQIEHRAIAALGTVSVFVSHSLLNDAITAWSEPVFILLTVLFLAVLSRYLNDGSRARLLVASLLAALACLQRYMGIAAVCTGCLLIVFGRQHRSWQQRVRDAVLFGALALAPAAAWSARNHAITSVWFRGGQLGRYTLAQNLRFTADAITRWFLPQQLLPLGVRSAAVLAYALAVAGAWLANRRYHGGRRPADPLRLSGTEEATARLVVVYVLAYVVFMVYSATTVPFEQLNDRYYSPLYVFVMLLVFMGIDVLLSMVCRSALGFRSALAWGITGLCVVFVLVSAVRSARRVYGSMQMGVTGYSTAAWRESHTISAVKRLPVANSVIYTNDPKAVYILADRPARTSPYRHDEIAAFRESLSATGANYLVWFADVDPPDIYRVDELSALVQLSEVALLGDGAIYRIEE